MRGLESIRGPASIQSFMVVVNSDAEFFSGKGFSTTEESLQRYNNSSGIATRRKSPITTIYEVIDNRNKRSRSGLLFDHGISGAQKICEKNIPEFWGHSLFQEKAPEKFCGHSKISNFRGHNTSLSEMQP